MLHERLADVVGPRYALERELPGGGMAQVFLARDPLLDRRVVIKVLPPERATAVGMERFHREARLLARLNHPHIIPILDTGSNHELPWFAMPWIAGETLAARIAAGPLDARQVRTIGRELLDALAHAHRLGVVHRDIKPANIFLNAGHALLADFGVASLAESSDDGLTDAGVLVGTLAYMAPEHRTEGVSDARSDLWELAATLYEAATGVRWTTAASTGTPWQGVPSELLPALQRALAEQPSDRWPDAESFAIALRRRRAAVGRPMFLAAGLSVLVLIAGWQGFRDRRLEPAQHGPTARVHFIPESGSPTWVHEVARNATTTLEWLPSTGAAAGTSPYPTPIQIRMRAAGGADSALFLEGVDATGRFVLRGRVLRATDEWSRSVADVVVEQLFPAGLADFRLLTNSTESVPALHAWYQGSAAFQSARWDDAERHFRQALRHDPGFIAASWSLLLTDMWRRAPHYAALQDLVARGPELPPLIRSLVEAQVEPHLPTRMRRFDSLAAAHPEFWAARMIRANELFHRGPLIGRSLREGTEAFVDAAEEVPELDHRATWQQVLWGAIRLGDEPLARQAWQRLAQWPGDLELHAFLGLALDARFTPHGATARRGLLHLFARGGRLGSMARYLRLGNGFDIPVEVRRMTTLVARRSAGTELEAAALATLATTLLMTGRVAEALDALDAAAGVAGDSTSYLLQAAEWRTLLPMFGLTIDAQQQEHAGAILASLSGHPDHWPRAVWALAISDSTGLGASWGDSLRRGAVANPIAAHLWPLWSAHQVARDSGAAAALRVSAVIHFDPTDATVVARGPLARAVTYLARGHWQLAQGEQVAAIREWGWYQNNDLQGWPSGPPQDGELDAALSVPGRALQAALLCRTGAAVEGRHLLTRARTLWSGADRPRTDLLSSAVAACR